MHTKNLFSGTFLLFQFLGEGEVELCGAVTYDNTTCYKLRKDFAITTTFKQLSRKQHHLHISNISPVYLPGLCSQLKLIIVLHYIKNDLYSYVNAYDLTALDISWL